MFQLNTFLFWLFSKEKILLFTKHMRIQSRSYNKNKRSFSTNPFAPHSSRIRKIFFKFEFVHLEFGLFYFIFFPSLFFFYSLPPLLKSHRFDPVESDPFSHWAKGTKQIWLIFRSKILCEIFGFFLKRYPAFESIENLFFYICMNRYYSIPIPSRHLPRKIPRKSRIGSQIDGLVWAYPCGYALFE